MSCYSPLTAYKGKSTDSGKMSISFQRRDGLFGSFSQLKLPCGQCVGCRLERSRQWAVRCMHEASLYDENSFLTLTYNEESLPRGAGFCSRCKVPHILANSLCVSTFQDFMKSLRKSLAPKPIRFYHCGEYGEQLGRPHYHALVFNHSFSDRKFFSSKGGNSVYTSESLARLWPHGFSVIGDVTFDSAAYVARYIMKKVTGEPSEAHYGGRRPEYTTMSRRPGIGAAWYRKFFTDVFPLDRVVVNGKETRPPRFYDRLLEKDDRSLFEQIKIIRESACNYYVSDVLSDGTEIRVSDQSDRRLLVKEEVKKAEIKTLVRPLEVS